jgi:S1-C subfamily serine protease
MGNMNDKNLNTRIKIRRPKLGNPLKLIQGKTASTGLMLLVVLAVGFSGGWLGSESRSQSNSFKSGTVNQQIILNESQLISEIAKSVGPNVVSVNVTSQAIQESFFGFTQPIEQQSAGTGVIISEDGYVVTNRHVVPRGVSEVSVTLSDGTELDDVEVVGRTNDGDTLDIAFLKINDKKGKSLTAARIGDSSKMQVGDKVVAIGNALGQFQNTVTSGIISGFGRSVEAGDESGGNVESLQNLLQTDASINQGNSGGPLVNINGEVIGINTAVAGGAAENIGFAIPVNDVQGLIKSVLSKGKLERPYLGIRYVSLTDDYAYQYNLDVKRGAYIAPTRNGRSIIENSPAEKAGLREKDIITKIDGDDIDENNSLISLISRKAVGEEVELTIIRDGKEQKIKVRLEAAPEQ